MLEMEISWLGSLGGRLPGAAQEQLPNPNCFFLVSEDPDHLSHLGSEESWEGQVPVRLIKQKDI